MENVLYWLYKIDKLFVYIASYQHAAQPISAHVISQTITFIFHFPCLQQKTLNEPK